MRINTTAYTHHHLIHRQKDGTSPAVAHKHTHTNAIPSRITELALFRPEYFNVLEHSPRGVISEIKCLALSDNRF